MIHRQHAHSKHSKRPPFTSEQSAGEGTVMDTRPRISNPSLKSPPLSSQQTVSTSTETYTGAERFEEVKTLKSSGTQVGDSSFDRILIPQKRAPRGSVGNEVMACKRSIPFNGSGCEATTPD